MNLISQSLLCLRVSSQEVSCEGEGSASGLIASQNESNGVCYNCSPLKAFLCLTVTSINHQLEEVLTLQVPSKWVTNANVSIVHANDHTLCSFKDISKFTTDNVLKKTSALLKEECKRDILILWNDFLKTLTEIVTTGSYKNFMNEVKHIANNACIQ